MNFDKFIADKKAIPIPPKSISKIYRLFSNLAWYEDYYEYIDDLYRATISEQDIERGYITLPYYIGSIFHFFEIDEQDEFVKELTDPTTESNIMYLTPEIKAGMKIELCCYRDTQPDDDHWGQSNWINFETAGAGWMWLGYKSDRETIKAIRRRARPYKADTYLYYDNGEPIICWWEDKRKCLTEVRLSNDEHIMF